MEQPTDTMSINSMKEEEQPFLVRTAPMGKKKDKQRTRRYLAILVVGAITGIYSVVEITVAVMKTNSIAMLSDGVHNLSDVIALVIAYWALRQSSPNRRRNPSMTFGWRRSEVLGAVMNGCFLISLALYIVLDSIPKFREPKKLDVEDWWFISVAAAGLGVNTLGTVLFALISGGHGHVHAGGGGGHSHENGHNHKENHGHTHGEQKKKQNKKEEEDKDKEKEEEEEKVDDEKEEEEEDSHDNDENQHDHTHKEGKENNGHAHGEGKKEKHGHVHKEGKKEKHGHDHEEGRKEKHGHAHEEGRKEKHGHAHEEGRKEKHGHAHEEGRNENNGHAHEEGRKEKHGHAHEEGKLEKHGHAHEERKKEKKGHGHHDEDSTKSKDHNIYAVFIHYLGDALSSLVVLVAGLLTKYLPDQDAWTKYLDPVCSVLIVILILYTTIPLIKDCAQILLQQVPTQLGITELKAKLRQVPGIRGIHDFHVWQLVDDLIIASLHATLEESPEDLAPTVAKEVKKILHQFGIHSSTLQLEQPDRRRTGSHCTQNCIPECGEDWCCKGETALEMTRLKNLDTTIVADPSTSFQTTTPNKL